MGRKVVRDARAEQLGVTRIGAVGAAPPADSTTPASPPPPTTPTEKLPLRERLRGARSLSETLNRETDRLNEAFLKVQTLIGECQLGVRATVEMPNGKTLVYGRLGKEWCIHIEDSATSILKASREDRLDAARVVGTLLDALATEASRMKEKVETVTVSLGELCEAIVEATRDE